MEWIVHNTLYEDPNEVKLSLRVALPCDPTKPCRSSPVNPDLIRPPQDGIGHQRLGVGAGMDNWSVILYHGDGPTGRRPKRARRVIKKKKGHDLASQPKISPRVAFTRDHNFCELQVTTRPTRLTQSIQCWFSDGQKPALVGIFSEPITGKKEIKTPERYRLALFFCQDCLSGPSWDRLPV